MHLLLQEGRCTTPLHCCSKPRPAAPHDGHRSACHVSYYAVCCFTPVALITCQQLLFLYVFVWLAVFFLTGAVWGAGAGRCSWQCCGRSAGGAGGAGSGGWPGGGGASGAWGAGGGGGARSSAALVKHATLGKREGGTGTQGSKAGIRCVVIFWVTVVLAVPDKGDSLLQTPPGATAQQLAYVANAVGNQFMRA
jgi:hypothetical protein